MTTRFTERLRLEPVGVHLFEDFLTLHQDDGIARWYGRWTPDVVREHAETFERGWARDGVSKWIAYDRNDGTLIGRGGLSRIVLEGAEILELGWALRERFWGRGYATEIGRAGLVFAFDELDADEVFAFTERRNERSWAVMERLGMRYVRDMTEDRDEPFVLYVMRRDWMDQGSRP